MPKTTRDNSLRMKGKAPAAPVVEYSPRPPQISAGDINMTDETTRRRLREKQVNANKGDDYDVVKRSNEMKNALTRINRKKVSVKSFRKGALRKDSDV